MKMPSQPKPTPLPKTHERTSPSGQRNAPDMKMNGKPLRQC